ncbi:hypothetical protein DEI92_02905 [Curtobacterium sp. MCBD17_034]|nr:hypothetical protein DEI92_02905 [Curtobacterium sp. MCBD17_034]PZM39846.1 hypothetical protein DEI90_03200 [Curtobacterium sp. MCBD17_031]
MTRETPFTEPGRREAATTTHRRTTMTMTTTTRSLRDDGRRSGLGGSVPTHGVRVTLAVVLALLSVTGATGCAAESGRDEAGRTRSSAPSTDANAFSACMRDRGIPMEDSDPTQGGERAAVPEGVDPDAYQRALVSCAEERAGGAEPAEAVDADPEVSRCMREHGITDYPDPVHGQVDYDPGDPPSSAFLAAEETCWKQVHGAEIAK